MKILAVTSCLSGVAHTYLAAEALEKQAKAKGIEIKIETQGSIGIENRITVEDIKDADVVILTKDIEIEGIDRFKGMPIFKIAVNDLVRKPNQVIEKVQEYLNSRK